MLARSIPRWVVRLERQRRTGQARSEQLDHHCYRRAFVAAEWQLSSRQRLIRRGCGLAIGVDRGACRELFALALVELDLSSCHRCGGLIPHQWPWIAAL